LVQKASFEIREMKDKEMVEAIVKLPLKEVY
jgi:hypothetical protein